MELCNTQPCIHEYPPTPSTNIDKEVEEKLRKIILYYLEKGSGHNQYVGFSNNEKELEDVILDGTFNLKELGNIIYSQTVKEVLDCLPKEKFTMARAIKYKSDAGAGHVIGWNSFKDKFLSNLTSAGFISPLIK